jgi:hypothetical protein
VPAGTDKSRKDPEEASDPFEDDLGPKWAMPFASPTDNSAGRTGTPAGLDDAEGALRARALDMYRSELVTWFMSRFEIRGKIPFDTLKGLQAVVSVRVMPTHQIGGYDLAEPSGNAVFDAEVRGALERIEASGATIPPPPPLYPNALGSSLSIRFACSVRSRCE